MENEHRVAVLDVETTGLNPSLGDRICEIGLVLANGDQIEDTYSSLVNPQRPISAGAAAVNGLTDNMLVNAPLFAEIADAVLTRLENRILICHNLPFDYGFLKMETSRIGINLQIPLTVDTLAIARRYGRFPSNSLEAIAHYLGLNTANSHRALADALTTFKVWQYFQRSLDIAIEELLQTSPYEDNLQNEIQIPPLIHEALHNQSDIEIMYIDRTGTPTRRLIRPLEVFVTVDAVYLVAYCHLRQDKRHFRLDRIVSISQRKD
ncbi:MAG: exonuclease domain-containing protein [Anaerolineales bacterium]